jgi:hypothetical protein
MSPPFILYLATPFPQCLLLSSLQRLVKTISHLDYSAKPAVHSFHWYWALFIFVFDFPPINPLIHCSFSGDLS